MTQKIIHVLALMVLLASCQRTHEAAQDHDHEHGEVKLTFTAYSGQYEVFAEADPFAVGSPSTILVHITNLSGFQPVEAGRVSLSMISGNKGIRQTLEAPERPGVYDFSLIPEVTGEARLMIALPETENDGLLELGQVMVYTDAHEAIHEEELLLREVPGAIAFTKEQSWRIDFATDLVRQEFFGPVIKTVGVVQPTHGDETTIHAGTRGMISFAGNRIYEGSAVSTGGHMLTIASAAIADDNATIRYREARNNYEKSKADFERVNRLYKEKILSERELLEAKNAFVNAELLYENLSRHFSENGQLVSSPYDGFVRELFVSEGQFVETGQAIVRIAQNREMMIQAAVQQRYAAILPHIQEVSIGLPGSPARTLPDIGGSVLSIGQAVHPQSNMIPVNLSLTPSNQLTAGSLVDVYIRTATDKPVPVVPNSALVEEQENFFVFVQINPESFLKQQVHTGFTDGIHTEIRAGLSAGERIVTQGAIMVKLAAAAGDLDPHAGHVH